MVNLTLGRSGRLVTTSSTVDLYHVEPVKTFNMTNVSGDATTSTGTLYFSSFPPSGIDIYNRWTGAVASYDASSTLFKVFDHLDKDFQFKRSLTISGANFVQT